MKIIAVVVTHNRSELLLRCIKGIRNQSRKLDKILVVNNGSTDNTEQVLASNKIDFISQDNQGSAGGWHSGIQYAINKDFDYVWMMDDDGFPDQNALEQLINHINIDVSCISSIVVREDDPKKFVFGYPDIDDNGNPKILSFLNKTYELNRMKTNDSGLIPYAHLFNGALISIDHVKKIGNVNKNYFMYGDEVDYYFRLRSVGKVISSIDAIHNHPNIFGREYSLMRVYYNIKNNLINYDKHYNFKFIRKITGPIIILFRVLKTNGPTFVFSLLLGKHSKEFYMAVKRGFQKKIGHDFEDLK